VAGLVVSLSGCLTPGPGTPIKYGGDFETTDGQFQMNGTIADTTASGPFEDVRVYFYTENKVLIKSTNVGTLPANVSLTASQIPYYIIIDSPDFWKKGATVHSIH